MRRREFIAFLGVIAAAWPVATRAQRSAMPAVGFLHQGSSQSDARFAAAFRKGLNEIGYVEGQNLTIESRWAEGQYDRLPTLAVDLIGHKVSVIAAAYSIAALAAKAAKSNIPIVFITGVDPVEAGFVQSLNRPGGNMTGVSDFGAALGAKRLGLLHDLLPPIKTFALLFNPNNSFVSPALLSDVHTAALTRGLQIIDLPASTDAEIDRCFTTIVEQKIRGLMVAGDAFLDSRRNSIVASASSHAIPIMFDRRESVEAGGLMSYGTDFQDAYRQQGVYVGRILKGEKPDDLPVVQPEKFDFAINLKTAKALGLDVPASLLSIADEVIE
jgi:putative ABC transport system substrate-binding protein